MLGLTAVAQAQFNYPVESDKVTITGYTGAGGDVVHPVILSTPVNFGIRTNGFGFTISWATNLTVVVEVSTDVSCPTWFPVGTNTLVSGSSYFSDPYWTNDPAQFYRLRSL